jgi:hypothetical protein
MSRATPDRPASSTRRSTVPVPPVPALLAALAAPLLLGPSLSGTPSGTGRPSVGDAASPWPGSTIVAVEGDARYGFSVTRLDGSVEHPPTLSEATAECEEHDDPTDAAVCVARVETRYAGLDDVRLSLEWARRDADR